MRKVYESPEVEIEKFTLVSVFTASPEQTTKEIGIDDNPNEFDEGDDFGF